MSTANQGFWKYASSFTGTSTVEDLFLKWAASENMTINDAKSAWVDVNKDIATYFPKRKANDDVEISGDPEKIKALFSAGGATGPIDVDMDTNAVATPGETPPPITEEETSTLANELTAPEEEGAGATTPPATPPAV